MDQVLSFSEDSLITEDLMSVALGLARISSIQNLGEGIILGDYESASKSYLEMLQENVSVKNICTNLLDFFFELINNIDNVEKTSLSSEASGYVAKATIDEFFWINRNRNRSSIK